jgi:uncharacterized iron-regulated membrane protein
MRRLRTLLFWCHLTAGVTGGIVIFVMSATGAMLAFEPQIVALLERNMRHVPDPGSHARLDLAQLITLARLHKPGPLPTGLTISAERTASVAVSFGREIVYLNPYTGESLGEGASRARGIFQTLTSWHRWLGSEGSGRAMARAITGASNLTFLCLALSGLYLWWPRQWSRSRLNAITTFDPSARGKSRDFNWHNVIGFWCAPVLVVLTATGVVMSYPWANNLLYRLTGSTSPAAINPGGPTGAAQGGGGRGGRSARGGERRDDGERDRQFQMTPNLQLLVARAEQTLPSWGAMTIRLTPRPNGPVSFTMTDAAYSNSFARSQLTFDGATGDVVRWEPYSSASLGQKARGWVRFGHTGELAGWPGQLVAGVACLGGTVLVYSGLALALRRFLGWQRLKAVRRPPIKVDDRERSEEVA